MEINKILNAEAQYRLIGKCKYSLTFSRLVARTNWTSFFKNLNFNADSMYLQVECEHEHYNLKLYIYFIYNGIFSIKCIRQNV